MINTRLTGLLAHGKKYIAYNVLWQWISLLAQIGAVFSVADLLGQTAALLKNESAFLIRGKDIAEVHTGSTLMILALCAAIRFVCERMAVRASYQASADVKQVLRKKIYRKMRKLGASYHEQVSTSEVMQICTEGVEQLEIYFGRYLPQLFYSLLAPLTLFFVLMHVSFRASVVLLICVPLIPVSIVAVQKLAKRLLNRYWSIYTGLGDSFLENLQGLTTLKIYQADEMKAGEMDEEAQKFRRITMKVLTMQLNSVTLMDLMAYGGAGLGIISAVSAFAKGQLSLTATLTIVLLAADFFLPLRLLGSYFHIAMNGAASAEKIFKLLAAEEPADGEQTVPEQAALQLEHVTFGYEKDRTILQDVSLTIPQGSFVSLVGESGCGKSTIAALLSGSRTGYTGSVTLGGVPVEQLQRAQRLRALTLVPHNATIFKGTVEANLRMAKPDATEAELWAALEQVNLADFCRSQDGLQTALHEGGSNLSGGQRQRLAMARALLHDTPIYLFDEATSNVDAESENDIMAAIRSLAGRKTVILISHRLANVVDSDCIYVLDKGRIAERGTHAELLKKQGAYSRLYTAQKQLETLETEDA